MPSAKNFLGLLEKLQSADITVHQNRCAVVRNRNATCMKCAEVCTSGCISYNDNELIISPEKCIGCGTCATVCPTCALEAHRPNDAELLHRCIQAMRAADGEVVIACEQIVNAAEGLLDLEKVVPVTCLGRVEESLLVTLAVAGAKHVSLVEGKCASCEHATGFHMAEQVRDTANTLLETWNSDTRVDLTSKFPHQVRLEGKSSFDAGKRLSLIHISDYEPTIANKAGQPRAEIVTLCGKHCESGDAVVIDMPLQTPDLGDVIAVFGTGAYCYTMASNYNGQPRPGIVFVKDGQARVVTRRETYADLYHRDI